MKLVYCINQDNPHARSLGAKLADQPHYPGNIIYLTCEEMKVLLDIEQFAIIEVNDREKK